MQFSRNPPLHLKISQVVNQKKKTSQIPAVDDSPAITPATSAGDFDCSEFPIRRGARSHIQRA